MDVTALYRIPVPRGQTQSQRGFLFSIDYSPRGPFNNLKTISDIFKVNVKSDYIHEILVGCISRWNGGATASLRRSQTAGWHVSSEMLSRRWGRCYSPRSGLLLGLLGSGRRLVRVTVEVGLGGVLWPRVGVRVMVKLRGQGCS